MPFSIEWIEIAGATWLCRDWPREKRLFSQVNVNQTRKILYIVLLLLSHSNDDENNMVQYVYMRRV